MRPMREAGVERVKWTPSTTASVLRTRSRFLEKEERTAQSWPIPCRKLAEDWWEREEVQRWIQRSSEESGSFFMGGEGERGEAGCRCWR